MDALGTENLNPRWPTILGRVISEERLHLNFFEVNRRSFSFPQEAGSVLDALITEPIEVARERYGSYRLGQYLMWSTFDPGYGHRPFEGISDDPQRIRGILGLEPGRSEPLFVLEYTLPNHVVPAFPTIADAYAGWVWPYYFSPAPAGEPHGWTIPREDH